MAITSLDIAWQQTVYERDVTPGSLNSLCLPYAVNEIPEGMEVYEMLCKTMEGDTPVSVDFAPVTTIEACKPYVFITDKAKVHLELNGEEAGYEAEHVNGLYGTFVDYPFADDDNYSAQNYYVINNNIIQAASNKSGVRANRAFIKMNEVPDRASIADLPSRRLVVTGHGFNLVDTTTPIMPTTSDERNCCIYDLSGRGFADKSALQRGINVVNGKKIIK